LKLPASSPVRLTLRMSFRCTSTCRHTHNLKPSEPKQRVNYRDTSSSMRSLYVRLRLRMSRRCTSTYSDTQSELKQRRG
jgi:hypothetical protein